MSWENRDYSRGSFGRNEGYGGDFLFRLVSLLNWSFPAFRLLNVTVCIHITFVIVVALELLRSFNPALYGGGFSVSEQLWWTTRWLSLLWVSVLVHEYGHCLAARRVGGQADQILMWPLGGLAFCEAPHRPWPQFVTVIWGPLTNILIAAACYLALALAYPGPNPASLNPFDPWAAGYIGGWAALVRDLFVVNYSLTLFNLALMFYPFDAGRLIQIGLWTIIGYRRSMKIATTWGMVAGVATALFAIAVVQSFLVFGIALFGFASCWQQRRLIREMEQSGEFLWSESGGPDFGGLGGGEPPARRRKKGWLARWREKQAIARERREVEQLSQLQAEVDRILEKVHNQGLASLTAAEKQTLQRATERERDLSETLRR